MEKFIINGGKLLYGEVSVSGAKNVALKALVAACLTEEEVVIENIPLISDFFVMIDIIKHLGGIVRIDGHTATVQMRDLQKEKISLERAAEIRTSSMFIAPLLARLGKAVIPNPGGCRIGARPIDRMVKGLEALGATVDYDSTDGYFHASVQTDTKRLQGATYRFEKPTHTGTETLLIASSLAEGETVLENVALEPEVDELIGFLNQMGANITRAEDKTIHIKGVSKLHGATIRIGPDRNEVVTLAIAAILTGGDIFIKDITTVGLQAFLEALDVANGGYEVADNGIRFFAKGPLKPTQVTTAPFPGFMTDWQSPWAVFMTAAEGTSTIHEAVYESRFGYVSELLKMGARITLFQPDVENPETFYNFNLSDDQKNAPHAIKVHGPVTLHNAVVKMSDLRAGATLVLAALVAKGETVILGLHHLDRGYEQFETRLRSIGADIQREKDIS